MTDGDMGVFLKLNGGMLYWKVKGVAEVDKSGENLHVDETANVIFSGPIVERYDEIIASPFPYALKVYDDNSVVFTLYTSKGGPGGNTSL